MKWGSIPSDVFCKTEAPLPQKELYGFLRSDSLQVDATLRHWRDAVTASNTTDGTVDTLVVSGFSAGTFAILNHIDQIQPTPEILALPEIGHFYLLTWTNS